MSNIIAVIYHPDDDKQDDDDDDDDYLGTRLFHPTFADFPHVFGLMTKALFVTINPNCYCKFVFVMLRPHF